MGDVFILNDYGKLGKNGDHLLYTNSKGESKKILPFQTDMIVLGGYISITAEATRKRRSICCASLPVRWAL